MAKLYITWKEFSEVWLVERIENCYGFNEEGFMFDTGGGNEQMVSFMFKDDIAQYNEWRRRASRMARLTDARLKHMRGVAEMMYNLVIEAEGSEDYAREMFVLGMLHDLGYGFQDGRRNHPQVVGDILRRCGYKYWQEVYHHGNPETVYSSNELNLLDWADLCTSSDGEPCSIHERIARNLKKDGLDAPVTQNKIKLGKRIGLLGEDEYV